MSRIQQVRTRKPSPTAISVDRETLARQHDVLNAGTISPSGVSQLQRMIGNRAVQQLISPRTSVSRSTAQPLIQRQGTYNPINIMAAGNNAAIEEQEIGQGANIAFTTITSCVGFIARQGNQLYGLHLGVMDAGGTSVDTINLPNLVQAITNVWPANPDVVYQVGMINNWQGAVLQAIYPAVLTADELNSNVNVSGQVYSASININNKMEVSRGGQLIYTEP